MIAMTFIIFTIIEMDSLINLNLNLIILVLYFIFSFDMEVSPILIFTISFITIFISSNFLIRMKFKHLENSTTNEKK